MKNENQTYVNYMSVAKDNNHNQKLLESYNQV